MLKINNVTFKEFKSIDNAEGYYKKYKRQVKFFDSDKKLIAVLNKYGCLCCANIQKDGSIWYNYDTPKLFENYKSEELTNLAVKRVFNTKETEYYFN